MMAQKTDRRSFLKAAGVLAVPLPPRLANKELGVHWAMNAAVAEYRQGHYAKADVIETALRFEAQAAR